MLCSTNADIAEDPGNPHNWSVKEKLLVALIISYELE
jgi:hypothetical protein